MTEETEMYMGTETILLVDDNESLLSMMSNMLEIYGYNVIIAVDGQDAIEKYTNNCGSVNLVISDIVMPRKDGISTYKEIKAINPNAIVLLTSGQLPDNTEIPDNIIFIPKPFKLHVIAKIIRETLDSKKS